MASSDKWACVDNAEEELNYEYSDDDDDNEVPESRSSSPDFHLSKANYYNFSDDDFFPLKKLDREFRLRERVQPKPHFKRRWRHLNCITGNLRRWRIRSYDHLFNLHKFNRKQMSQNRVFTRISKDETKEIEQFAEIAVIVNNDLYQVSTVTDLYNSASPGCSKLILGVAHKSHSNNRDFL
ncbi:hypothetical protein Zmor_002893 [Zophobas morio]|uniref:Uncharacterized protein n=1 Tax=Zophobas morio TaxID=2755281 RepID=A0AA38HM01_9CUCU|nr:hypothetical protein Zmor_002893 [Zophobas morio]